MSIHLQRDFEELKGRLLTQSASLEVLIREAVKALQDRSGLEHAAAIADRAVERECWKMLALFGPTELDLQRLTSAIKISDALDRAVSLAADVARRSQSLVHADGLPMPGELDHVGDLIGSMMRLALESFLELEVRVARHIYVLEQEAERLCRKCAEQFAGVMRDRPEFIPAALEYHGALRDLAGIAVLATDIASDVLFVLEGETRFRRVCTW